MLWECVILFFIIKSISIVNYYGDDDKNDDVLKLIDCKKKYFSALISLQPSK